MLAKDRCILDEASLALQQQNASILWDVQAFYDSIDLVQVLESALALNFPPIVLVMELKSHLAPRVLQENNGYSKPILPTSSIIPGIKGANDFARCTLFALMDHVHRSYFPRVTSKSWVDDVNQRAQGTKQFVLKHLVSAGICFAEGIQSMGLILSSKSVVINSFEHVLSKRSL